VLDESKAERLQYKLRLPPQARYVTLACHEHCQVNVIVPRKHRLVSAAAYFGPPKPDKLAATGWFLRVAVPKMSVLIEALVLAQQTLQSH
jgi:hypothetical protein